MSSLRTVLYLQARGAPFTPQAVRVLRQRDITGRSNTNTIATLRKDGTTVIGNRDARAFSIPISLPLGEVDWSSSRENTWHRRIGRLIAQESLRDAEQTLTWCLAERYHVSVCICVRVFIQILRQGFYQSLRKALFNTLLVSTCFILKIYLLAHIHNSFLRAGHTTSSWHPGWYQRQGKAQAWWNISQARSPQPNVSTPSPNQLTWVLFALISFSLCPLCCSCKSHTESSLFNCLQEKVTNKDVFSFLFPDGYQNVESVSDELGLTPPPDKSFVVLCDKCGRATYSSSRTNYTGPGVHARSCYDEDWLENTIREGRAEYHREGKITKKFQEGLKSSFAMASKKDQDLYVALDLIIHHNIPITKFRDHEFSRHFNWKIGPPHYQTIVDTMVELFFVVNDSIAGEITDQKGVIHHDG